MRRLAGQELAMTRIKAMATKHGRTRNACNRRAQERSRRRLGRPSAIQSGRAVAAATGQEQKAVVDDAEVTQEAPLPGVGVLTNLGRQGEGHASSESRRRASVAEMSSKTGCARANSTEHASSNACAEVRAHEERHSRRPHIAEWVMVCMGAPRNEQRILEGKALQEGPQTAQTTNSA